MKDEMNPIGSLSRGDFGNFTSSTATTTRPRRHSMAPSGLQDSSFSANTNQPPYLNASNNQRHDPSAKGLPTNSSLLPPTSTINLPLDMPSTARASKPSLTFSPLNKRTIKKEHNSPVGILSRANSYPLSKEAGSGSAPPTVVKLEPGTTASKRMRTSTGGNSLVTKEEVSLGGSSRKIKKEEGLAEGGTALSSRKEKDAKLASLAKDEEEFVTKYTKAFPSFVFHFDCVEPGALGARVVDLGAVSPFSSSPSLLLRLESRLGWLTGLE
jgi:hypothetical protein